MPLTIPTNQETYCYDNNQTAYCQKQEGIVCGYDDGAESACARAIGTPVPSPCDCDTD